MMSAIQVIEDALVGQLTQAFTHEGDVHPWLKVEGWPTRPEGYSVTGAGDVLVIYKGGRHDPQGISPQFYESVLEFEIALRARSLREHTGAYEMLDTARRAVCGKRIEQAKDVTLAVRDDFVDYGEGIFAYSLIVRVPVVTVQSIPDAPGPWIDETSGQGMPLQSVSYALDATPNPFLTGERDGAISLPRPGNGRDI